MSKSKMIIIVIVAFILVAGTVCACFFLFGGKEQAQQSLDDRASEEELAYTDNWLTIDSVDKLESFARKRNLKIEYDMSNAYIHDLPFADGVTTYCYDIGEEGKITGLNIGYILVGSTEAGETFTMDNVDAQALSDRVGIVMGWVSDLLAVQVGSEFYIISVEGDLLSVEDISSYQQILDGNAYLELRILDTNGSIWLLNVERVGDYNIVSCTFQHCPPDSDEAKIPCNIAIE